LPQLNQAETDHSLAQWYAVYTRSRHEKIVGQQMVRGSIDHFLPLYETVRKWKDRRAKVQLPLFPGYLFVRIAPRNRLRVLQVPGVVGLVGSNGMPVALPQAEIETIRDALQHGIHAEPHRYLKVGSRVRIKAGALEGLTGILQMKKGQMRVVVAVELIMRSIAVDVDAADVEPMK
jgi:transcription termination/antitermination protein NusG